LKVKIKKILLYLGYLLSEGDLVTFGYRLALKVKIKKILLYLGYLLSEGDLSHLAID